MKINEIILHEFIIKVNDVSIFRNPVKPVLLNIFKDASKNEQDHKDSGIPPDAYDPEARLRGIIVGGKIYVWNTWDGMHFDIVKGMAREGFIDKQERQNYSAFYLKISKKQIIDYGFYTPGMRQSPRQRHKELLAKHLTRWNS